MCQFHNFFECIMSLRNWGNALPLSHAMFSTKMTDDFRNEHMSLLAVQNRQQAQLPICTLFWNGIQDKPHT